jgi:amidohydrolase
MIELGVLESPEVDAMFALHCMPALEAGKIGYTEGPVWANSNAFDITINGTSAHGAYPHQGVDAIHVASELTVALQSIPSRRVDARESSVVSVGRIEGGDSFNVLADKARIKGIFRSFSDEVSNNIEESIRRLASQISESQGATADIDISKGARAVINDRDTVRSAVDALESDGEKQIVRHEPQLGAEDFASFSRRVPSAYMFLGIRGDDRGHYGLHSPKFDVDERCIQFGVDRFSEMLKGLGKQDI